LFDHGRQYQVLAVRNAHKALTELIGQVGDVVHVELPDVGDKLDRDDEFGTIESVKAVSELYAPITGTVIAVNENLEDNPEVVNSDPLGRGWMIKVKLTSDEGLAALSDYASYQKQCAEEQH